MERKDNHGYGDGMHRAPRQGPQGGDTGQRSRLHDQRNKGALRQEEAGQFPTRPEMEREQEKEMR